MKNTLQLLFWQKHLDSVIMNAKLLWMLFHKVTSIVSILIHRGSDIGAHVLLNLLNELG